MNTLKKELEILIKEVLREELKKYVITEMVYDLKQYKENINNLIQQIVENWCLIRFATLSNEYSELKNHWRSELLAHMTNISSMRLKGSLEKVTTKEKALYSIFNQRDLDTSEYCIHMHIVHKFAKEKMPTNGEIYAQVIEDFKNSIKNIVDTILTNNYPKMVKYVETI